MQNYHKNYIISSKKTKEKESLLESTAITRRSAAQRRKGRFWQRIKSFITRMKANKLHGYRFAFLTLTSSEFSGEILHDWAILKKRIERKYGKVNYFAVREYNKQGDLVHLHLLLYTPFLPVYWLSNQWNEIHQAKIVYIKAVPIGNGSNEVLSYLAKYVSKTIPDSDKSFIRRFSYSLFYYRLTKCWRGFLKYYTSMYEFNLRKIIISWQTFLSQNDSWNYAILYDFVASLG